MTNAELSNPIFTAAVDADGTVSSAQSVGVDQSRTRKIEQVGGGVIYDVGFHEDISQCVYTATPGKTRRGGTLAPVILDVETRPSDDHVGTVFVRDADGSFFTAPPTLVPPHRRLLTPAVRTSSRWSTERGSASRSTRRAWRRRCRARPCSSCSRPARTTRRSPASATCSARSATW